MIRSGPRLPVRSRHQSAGLAPAGPADVIGLPFLVKEGGDGHLVDDIVRVVPAVVPAIAARHIGLVAPVK